MTAKLLPMDGAKADSQDQIRSLVAALRLTTAIAEDQLFVLLVTSTKTDEFGAYDMSTLAEEAKPCFERCTKAVIAANNALRKVGE